MTTYYNFTPSAVQPFQFQPTLDGNTYNVTVTWNVYGQRWYVNVFTLNGDLVFSLPLIGSPSLINLQALSWANGEVTATTAVPHGYAIGKTVALTFAGSSPDAYNGPFDAMSVGPNSLSYPLAEDPGQATVLGTVGYNIDLAGGYFETSTLVFREASNQFEVSP